MAPSEDEGSVCSSMMNPCWFFTLFVLVDGDVFFLSFFLLEQGRRRSYISVSG